MDNGCIFPVSYDYFRCSQMTQIEMRIFADFFLWIESVVTARNEAVAYTPSPSAVWAIASLRSQ
jgi:hypothetical protein